MAISFVGSDSGSQGANTTGITLTLPTHATDDFGIIYGRIDEVGTVPVLSIGTATGWTLLDNRNPTSGRDRVEYVWYKKFTSASETNPVMNTDTARAHSASVHVFRGVDTATPFDATFQFNSGANDTTPVNPAITPVTANGALILFDGATHNDITVAGLPATPTGLTLGEVVLSSGNNHRGQYTAYKLDYGAAATITPTAWTHTSSPTGTAEWSVYTIVLRPAALDIGTAVAALNTNASLNVDTTYIIRVAFENNAVEGGTSFRWAFNHDGGGDTAITTSTAAVKAVTGAPGTNGDDTQEIFTNTGSFITDNNAYSEDGTFSLTAAMAASSAVEAVLAFQLDSGSVANGETGTIRLELGDGTDFGTYTQTFTYTVIEDTIIVVPLDTMTMTDNAPTVETGANVDVPLNALTMTDNTPTVETGVNVDVPLDTFTMTDNAPTVETGVNIDTPLNALTMTDFAPAVETGVNVIVPLDTFTMTDNIPTLEFGVNVEVPLDTITMTEFVPGVSASPGADTGIVHPDMGMGHMGISI